MPLSVPLPVLSQEGSSATEFGAEKPFNLLCGPVAFDDGTPLTLDRALQFGFLIYREGGAITEVWDEKNETWVPENPQPEPQSLFAMDGIWKSILIAIGATDKASVPKPKFATDSATGFPKYFAKCFFKGRDTANGEQSGESPRTQSVKIVAFGEKDRAGLAITPPPPAPASQATHISLFLKDASLSERGRILIEEQSGGFVVELRANNASVKITGHGGIVLTPAAGAALQLGGDLTVSGSLSVSGNLAVAGLVNGTTIP